MLREIKYGALSGKTRAMFGKLLNETDYQELIRKKNVGEILTYLKNSNTPYAEALSEVDEGSIHRGHLENLIKHIFVNEFGKILRFARNDTKVITQLMYRRIEIESLKLIFRVFASGKPEHGVLEDSLLFLTGHDNIHLPKLALSNNLEEFLSGLKGTDYYEVLRPFASETTANRMFNMEMALDLYYLKLLKKSSMKWLSGRDRVIANAFVDVEIDMFNIFWIYRSKSYYTIPTEVIRSYILPNYGKIGKTTIEALLSAKSQEEFVRVLAETRYRFLFSSENEILNEHNYLEFIYKYYRHRFRADSFSIACVFSYIRLKEIEMGNLISIIEGVRYRLPPERMRYFVAGIPN